MLALREVSISGWLTAWRKIPLHQRIRHLRWGVLPLVVALVALHQFVTHGLFSLLPNLWHALLEWTVYSLTGVVASWLGLTWMARAVACQEDDAAKLEQAYADLKQMHQRLLLLHEIGCKAVNAADPLEVLELAVRAPVQLAEAVSTAVFTFDNKQERLKLEMTWGLGDTYIQALRRRVEEGIPAGRCRGCLPLMARVTDNCPLFQELQTQAQADGMASLVCLPIARDRERVGIISAYFASPDGPPEAQLRLLNIVATEIAVALESVHLRARQVAALATVERAAQRSSDLDTFLDQVLEAILNAWRIEAGAIFIYATAEGAKGSLVQRGLGDHPGDPRFALAARLSSEARASGRPIIESQSQPTSDHGFAFAIAVPLRAEREILGALFLASPHARAWSSYQTPFLTLLAHQTALAVRNAQLHLQIGHLAVLEERYRLSREMHDGLAQTLSYLGWQMDHLGTLLRNGRLELLATELAEARRMVREAYLDVREAIDGLRLAVDHPGGLPVTLQQYLADFSVRTGIVTEFERHGDGPGLTSVAALQLLRIAQEALINVRKHAGARHVWVRLNQARDYCELTITDDGQGFDPKQPRDHHHLGLATMRERAQSLGGTLTIATGPRQGTRIIAIIPTSGSAA